MAPNTGNTARQMAAAPLPSGNRPAAAGGTQAQPQASAAAPDTTPTPTAEPPNPLIKVLGASISFLAGNGKSYDRTEGWGSSKVPHRDGGTYSTVAVAQFRPFSGLDMPLEANIRREIWSKEGKEFTLYSVSVPFLKGNGGRRPAAVEAAMEEFKTFIRDAYRANVKKGTLTPAKAIKVSGSTWTDEDMGSDAGAAHVEESAEVIPAAATA